MESGGRTRLVALAVLLAVSVPLVVIALASGGSPDPRAGGLRVERAGGLAEMTLYVEDPSVNALATTDGADTVVIECLDGGGKVVFSERERWPFSDTDGGIFDPHVHLTLESDELLQRIERCRLRDTDPPLEGRLV
jgi:hypothetical protein